MEKVNCMHFFVFYGEYAMMLFILCQIKVNFKIVLQKKQSPTFLFYVSDHSECADIDDFTKRRSLVSQERACYEIPFLLWYSPEYADINSDLINSGKKNLTAPLQCDLALWSICDMAGISWDKFPVEKSIFSEEYIPPKKRFIYQAEY